MKIKLIALSLLLSIWVQAQKRYIIQKQPNEIKIDGIMEPIYLESEIA
ncbi:MAG: hypothetical protein RLZZ546_121, partial [Bacteroidota bacterium]